MSAIDAAAIGHRLNQTLSVLHAALLVQCLSLPVRYVVPHEVHPRSSK